MQRNEANVENKQWGKRLFAVSEDGTAHYKVVTGDNLWSIATDVLSHQQLEGGQPTNTAIQQLIVQIAQDNQITNPNLIFPEQPLTIRARS